MHPLCQSCTIFTRRGIKIILLMQTELEISHRAFNVGVTYTTTSATTAHPEMMISKMAWIYQSGHSRCPLTRSISSLVITQMQRMDSRAPKICENSKKRWLWSHGPSPAPSLKFIILLAFFFLKRRLQAGLPSDTWGRCGQILELRWEPMKACWIHKTPASEFIMFHATKKFPASF